MALRPCGPCVQGRAVSAHQAGDVGADHVDPHLLLKGAQHGLVVEGAALHHDVRPRSSGLEGG